MDSLSFKASTSVSNVPEEPQDLRRSLRVQRMSATKTTTPNRVVSPYFAKKPAGGKGLKRTMVNSAKREAGAASCRHSTHALSLLHSTLTM